MISRWIDKNYYIITGVESLIISAVSESYDKKPLRMFGT
jgi:hypothetical protein